MNDQFTLLFALQARAMTCKEVAEFLGIHISGAQRRVRRLHAKTLVRVVEYRRQPEGHKGEMNVIYGLADGKADVPKPERVPQVERRRKWEARYPERHLASQRSRAKAYALQRTPSIHERRKQLAQIRSNALWGQLLDPMRG